MLEGKPSQLVEVRTHNRPTNLLTGGSRAELSGYGTLEQGRRDLRIALTPERRISLEARRIQVSLIFLDEIEVGRNGLRRVPIALQQLVVDGSTRMPEKSHTRRVGNEVMVPMQPITALRAHDHQ